MFSGVRYNNIFGNDPNAQYGLCGHINWNRNYWETQGILPVKIHWNLPGLYLQNPVPFCRFDWNPVGEPYDIYTKMM